MTRQRNPQGLVNREWLDEKFANLSNKLDEHAAILREHMAQDRRDFDNVSTKLDSHNLRVDRLEQKETRREWHIRTIWAAMAATIAAMVAELLRK